ncbi:hypothetical protein WJX72_001293 [[Myrmecia] bisecta]|uniref:Uncharacterized protein n=1 Tax=[Myrmecia] bisecta TaxID=41462 RepID=A0AAW1QNZ6_9CHLO
MAGTSENIDTSNRDSGSPLRTLFRKSFSLRGVPEASGLSLASCSLSRVDQLPQLQPIELDIPFESAHQSSLRSGSIRAPSVSGGSTFGADSEAARALAASRKSAMRKEHMAAIAHFNNYAKTMGALRVPKSAAGKSGTLASDTSSASLDQDQQPTTMQPDEALGAESITGFMAPGQRAGRSQRMSGPQSALSAEDAVSAADALAAGGSSDETLPCSRKTAKANLVLPIGKVTSAKASDLDEILGKLDSRLANREAGAEERQQVKAADVTRWIDARLEAKLQKMEEKRAKALNIPLTQDDSSDVEAEPERSAQHDEAGSKDDAAAAQRGTSRSMRSADSKASARPEGSSPGVHSVRGVVSRENSIDEGIIAEGWIVAGTLMSTAAARKHSTSPGKPDKRTGPAKRTEVCASTPPAACKPEDPLEAELAALKAKPRNEMTPQELGRYLEIKIQLARGRSGADTSRAAAPPATPPQILPSRQTKGSLSARGSQNAAPSQAASRKGSSTQASRPASGGHRPLRPSNGNLSARGSHSTGSAAAAATATSSRHLPAYMRATKSCKAKVDAPPGAAKERATAGRSSAGGRWN